MCGRGLFIVLCHNPIFVWNCMQDSMPTAREFGYWCEQYFSSSSYALVIFGPRRFLEIVKLQLSLRQYIWLIYYLCYVYKDILYFSIPLLFYLLWLYDDNMSPFKRIRFTLSRESCTCKCDNQNNLISYNQSYPILV